jgi:membrane protein
MRLGASARIMLRRFASALASDLTEGEILTYASAMAFRTLFAAIPLALAFIALLGFLDLTQVWTADLAPTVQPTLGPAFPLLDGTVKRILVERQGFWLTLGLALAVWQLSSTIRVTADALDRIFGVENDRRLREWLGVSIAVSLGAALCLVVAAIGIYFGTAITERLFGPGPVAYVLGFITGWAIAAVAMLAAIALILRYMPGERVKWRFAGTGAVVTVVAWLLATAAFGVYATWVVDYGNLFGGLALPFVLLFYLNFSALFFLIGVWLERRRHTGVERPLQVETHDTE